MLLYSKLFNVRYCLQSDKPSFLSFMLCLERHFHIKRHAFYQSRNIATFVPTETLPSSSSFNTTTVHFRNGSLYFYTMLF